MTHPHRSHPTLTLVPVGGLANRMRAIVSAAALTGETGHRLHVVWFKDAGLNCRFDELFCPIGRTDIRLHEATFADFLLHDRPRRKNLWLPGLFQHAAFDARLYEQAPELAPGSPFDAGQWLAGHSRAYIATCYPFHPSPTSLYAALFRPVEAIERQVRTYTERFSAHTVGIHIRRTDNAMSIAHSPLSLFIQAMERELEAHPDTTFFVASDSEADKHTLRTHFGPRILTSSAPADRNSKAGMQQGAVDLFTLSRTGKIFGSCYSSFSEVAAMLRSIPYHRIQQGL